MKSKLLFQVSNKGSVPFEVYRDMKKSLNNITYSGPVIGPKTIKDMIKKNTGATGYTDTIFDELLTNKILSDYNTIINGLELLKFYKKNGLAIFDEEIKFLSEIKI